MAAKPARSKAIMVEDRIICGGEVLVLEAKLRSILECFDCWHVEGSYPPVSTS